MKSDIKVTGAKQNNLNNLSLDIGTEDFTIVTGVSGSGKSSLVFDTIYAEGQRKYIETFSPYARQFLNQMDRPDVRNISGSLPAIAIYQKNHIRNSSCTVGSLTEINDYLKIIFANNSNLFCEKCNQIVKKYTAESILEDLNKKLKTRKNNKVKITFPIVVSSNIRKDILKALSRKGYLDIYKEEYTNNKETDIRTIFVIQDNINLSEENQNRCYEALEAAMFMGDGEVVIYYCHDQKSNEITLRYNSNLKCNNCNLLYDDVTPSNFSFSSPLGACDNCSGFGDILEIDIDRVIPDKDKTLIGGAIKPWQTNTFKSCQDDLETYAAISSVSLSTPWKDLPKNQQHWVIYGDHDGEYSLNKWYGIKRFFSSLEKKTYKMHIRILLAKYRKYSVCPKCNGSRFNHKSLLWRIGNTENNIKNTYTNKNSIVCENNGAVNISDVLLMSVNETLELFQVLKKNQTLLKSDNQAIQEIETRLNFLRDIGLGYLTLDRKGKTLSGGEIQRINLTTALGSSLINTMFVLDEPSNGLHYKDIDRLVRSIRKLNEYGNCLVVIEHNMQLILSADRVVELGPGSGISGGNIIFDGPPCELYKADTITSRYANNKLRFEKKFCTKPIDFSNNTLKISKAKANNLKNISIKIPLNKLVCITGVSGSGKTTLLREVIYNGLNNKKNSKSYDDKIILFEKIDGYEGNVTLIDNSPIIRSNRSNIASYIGIFEEIRVLFSRTSLSIKRKYSPNTFSFNSGHGRCPTCSGSGLECVEMYFLPDIYLCCKDCGGKRFRKEILEIYLESNGKKASIDQILDMTVAESIEFFSNIDGITSKLSALVDIGLDYLKLGQTLATMSNGELRRIKLIYNVINTFHNKSKKQNNHLLLIDEPTLGLHVNEIYTLIVFLHKLIDIGYSIILIEHNLEVIRKSDWIIDLGPEGGDKGGYIVAEDYPESLANNNSSYTGRALIYDNKKIRPYRKYNLQKKNNNLTSEKYIEIYNAKENNLQNIDVKIPLNQLIVITGVSGSGKSTLAFDILFNEGQRRYLLTLNAYAKSIIQPSSKRANIGKVVNLPPTIAIKQHKEFGNYKSTVSNISEINNFLRLIYAKLGKQHCPSCNTIIETNTFDQIVAKILSSFYEQNIIIFSPINTKNSNFRKNIEKKDIACLFINNKSITTKELESSYNKDHIIVDILIGNIIVNHNQENKLRELVNCAINTSDGFIKIASLDNISTSIINAKSIPEMLSKKLVSEKLFNVRSSCVNCNEVLPILEPLLFSHNSKNGNCFTCKGTGIEINVNNRKDEPYSEDISLCNKCGGKRLNKAALSVLWHGYNIAEILSMSVDNAINFFKKIRITDREALIAKSSLGEIFSRLDFMKEVGLGYLELDRPEPTLSGGESQRVHLAAQLGSDTQGACYILDEPTIGLHPVDNKKLIESLLSLRNNGNTIVVVEHDYDMIKEASYIIDMGPGAGRHGGKIVAQGRLSDILKSKDSVTAKFLTNKKTKNLYKRRIDNETKFIQIKNANMRNLNGIYANFPLNCLNVVTGVSGSGKSTLIQEILFKNIHYALEGINKENFINCEYIEGIGNIHRIVSIDQNPIGKTPRSCPATYIGFWDEIRKKFANTTGSKIKGWDSSRFSFNSKDGRCKECNGLGTKIIEMNFMPDVKVVCECCNGLRFNKETLMVEFLDKNIGETLMMEVDQAMEHFINFPLIYKPLKFLHDIGLGYLPIGQSSSTLSGGESQRIKIVSELIKNNTLINKDHKNIQQHTLYIMDEPTTGLSMSDVDRLTIMLQELINSGNSIIAIEHNLDFIIHADWIVDIGPGGGSCGGNIVFQGTFKSLLEKADKLTLTQEAVQNFLQENSRKILEF